ncbi:MAG: 16S rRNA (guanine(966)-N(2))-methyltransferase RsmD [Acidobacteriota bacterium]
MENRRPLNSNTDKPFNRNRFQKRPTESSFGERKYPPRDDRFRPKNEGGQQRSEGRFQPREGSNQTTGDKFQPREGRFQGRDDNRFQNRDNKFQKRPFDPKKRFPSKGKPPEPDWKKDVRPKVFSEMQVTDGKLRGKFLTSSSSPKIKLTTRKLREIMFRMISRRIRGKRFLDICAGSGAVGIDAISRGALLGTFVERSAKMCSFIRKNMETMEIKVGHGELFELEAIPFLKQMAKRKRQWDVVFVDPPYDTNYDEILEYFKRGVCVKPRGILIIEHHAEMFFPEKLGVMKRWRVVVEGESALSFYERV